MLLFQYLSVLILSILIRVTKLLFIHSIEVLALSKCGDKSSTRITDVVRKLRREDMMLKELIGFICELKDLITKG